MNRQDLAWKRFEQTGCIRDYLAYCQMEQINSSDCKGDLPYADFHRRHRPQGEATGK